MTDLEMTKLCAEAMGIEPDQSLVKSVNFGYALANMGYNPLHNDAQAIALIKQFHLLIEWRKELAAWMVAYWDEKTEVWEAESNPNLNYAIVECVAKMEAAK